MSRWVGCAAVPPRLKVHSEGSAWPECELLLVFRPRARENLSVETLMTATDRNLNLCLPPPPPPCDVLHWKAAAVISARARRCALP